MTTSMTNAHLQHLIRRGLNTRHHVGGTESDLLHLGKVVLGVPVQHNPAHRDPGVLCLGPDLRGKDGGEEGSLLCGLKDDK